ncbi:hypothetical protein DPSP01_006716 [Paraphaeosphaeria sporulosa]|uniref:Uncharacterized protein n=1 Tax=Paraphaeosphaeria sporulosa TaxID=1460663 RepID=A0A177CF57_9PLEO|nr:uncharacterized protein CC84DRAFT_729612 [Paraphaeosphaeria sporulosa]OAG05572.1 hypothetical protein CC84DRAFT_729612 [Paraphaeosphaeria sporulosa]
MHFLKLHDTKSPFRCLSLLPLFQPSTALPNPQDSHTNPASAGTHDLISHFQYFLTPNPPTCPTMLINPDRTPYRLSKPSPSGPPLPPESSVYRPHLPNQHRVPLSLDVSRLPRPTACHVCSEDVVYKALASHALLLTSRLQGRAERATSFRTGDRLFLPSS